MTNMASEFTHCPLCGDTTIVEDFKHHFICTSCAYEQYISPKPCSIAILRDGLGRIGLSIRGKDPHKGTHDLIGGFIEPEEEAEEAMVREIQEEIGLVIDPIRLRYFTSKHDYYQYKNWMYYTLANIYELHLSPKEVEQIKPGDDVESLDWFEPQNIPWEKIAFIGTTLPLRKYLVRLGYASNPDQDLETLRQQLEQIDDVIASETVIRSHIAGQIGLLEQSQIINNHKNARTN
jgi:ADP-ribose pyrophosphatase YjhB (NUDIX family)